MAPAYHLALSEMQRRELDLHAVSHQSTWDTDLLVSQRLSSEKGSADSAQRLSRCSRQL